MNLYDNPTLYDLVHQGNGDDVDWYRRVIGNNSAFIIDLGCGTGRFSLPLADDGHHVLAIDNSAAMLALLQQRITTQRNICVVMMDVMDLLLPVQADVILAPCNFMSHFNDDDRAHLFNRIATALKPGGRFLLDISDATWHRQHPNVCKESTIKIAHDEHLVVQGKAQTRSSEIFMSFTVWRHYRHGHTQAAESFSEEIAHCSVRIQAIEEDKLRRELQRHGFIVQVGHRGFEKDHQMANGSRIVLLARKRD